MYYIIKRNANYDSNRWKKIIFEKKSIFVKYTIREDI